MSGLHPVVGGGFQLSGRRSLIRGRGHAMREGRALQLPEVRAPVASGLPVQQAAASGRRRRGAEVVRPV